MNEVMKDVVAELLVKFQVTPVANEEVDGRRFATDTFTTILAAPIGTGILVWAETHKKMVDMKWDRVKDGTHIPENDYEHRLHDSFLLCLEKPEVEIFYSDVIDGIEVVMYTDDIEAKTAEGLNFRGGK